MNAQDIMVGDWVRLRYKHWVTNEEVVKDFKVSQVRKTWDGDELYAWCSESGNMGPLSMIEPIPLTPEILEKNGFKKTKVGYFWREILSGYMGQTVSVTTPSEIRYEEGHLEVSNQHIGRIFYGSSKYVHELQHTLHICGIEKTIEL